MLTVENEYYLRFILLLCNGCSYITKKLIGKELYKTGEDLDLLLKKNEGNLRHEFHKKQMEKLFPNNGFDKTNIETWDIQMLVGVLLLIFRKTLSDKEKEKMKEIKEIRNNILAHSPNAALSREKYEAFQKQIQNAIKELASGFTSSVKIKCDEYITASASGPLDVNLAIKCSQELKGTDDKLQQILDDSQNTGQDIKRRLESISEQIRKLDEKTLRGMDEIRREMKDIKIEVEKQKKSTDGHTEPSKTDRDVQTVQMLEDEIEQKIEDCKRTVDPSVRTSLLPYNKSSGDEEKLCYKSTDDVATAAGNLQSKFSSPLEQKCVKSSVRRIHNMNDDVTTCSEKLLVCAIDVGTSFSGYAFSFGRTGNRTIIPRLNQSIYIKTSTSILFDPDEQFHSFGFEAEDEYAELVETNRHKDWYFFQNFKMQLYEGEFTQTKEFEAENGKKMDASKVFSAAISYFRNELLNNVQCFGLKESDIHWVLTVPSIWTDSAKEFMRKSAVQAGIERKSLLIAFESESASIYCLRGSLIEDGTVIIPVRSGTKYMVLDMGGGTVDITVCEHGSEMTDRVLHVVNDSACGGTKVDQEYVQFITGLTGQEVYSKFCRIWKSDHLELQREFELKKRTINLKAPRMTCLLPTSLFDMYKDETGKDFKKSVDESAYHKKVSFRRDKLNIDAQIVKTFFVPCYENVVRHISDILKTRAAKGVKILLLTGGFSNSELMQNAVANAFPNLRVLIPLEPENAVLRGSVILGHTPQTIKSRTSRHTYGIEITPLFDPSVHSESRRVSVNGQDRCRNVFRKFITKGEFVEGDDYFCHEHATLIPYQEEIVLKIYTSTSQNPRYVDEDDVAFLGTLRVQFPKREKSVLNVKLHFGATELGVAAVDLQNGDVRECNLHFLE